MNAIVYAINEIMHRIPNDILREAMSLNEDASVYHMSSLEEKILNKVLRQRVLITANVVGGIQHVIPIGQIQPTFSDNLYTIYKIPMELTMDKEIMSVLELVYMPRTGYRGVGNSQTPSGSMYAPYQSLMGQHNALAGVGSRIMGSHASSGVPTNAHTEIVATNTIAVYANVTLLNNYGLRVMLQNDTNMNNIPPRAYQAFAEMCTLATKAYVYQRLMIAINSGYLAGGQELGMFRTIVESYSDSEEQYQEFLRNRWGVTAFTSDTQRHSNFLMTMLAPDL